MKIIQSFWSKPSFYGNQEYNNSRKFAGWRSFTDFLFSTSFSCLTIRGQHNKIGLYTDNFGYDLLINQLKLPYDNVSLLLNKLEHEDHKLWIRGKVETIQDQSEPFIHVDNDIYIWDRLPDVENTKEDLIVQSRTNIWLEYKLSLNEIFANFDFIPQCLQERPTNNTQVANVGIIGGRDVSFLQEFSKVSNELLERNRKKLSLIDIGGFNQMMEEYLFTSMARYNTRDIKYLLEDPQSIYPPSYLHINLVPVIYKYIHLVGAYKQKHFACEQIALRMKHEFPKHYRIVTELISERYPDMADQMHDTSERSRRISKSLRIFYNNKFERILSLKIKLRDNLELFGASDYLNSETQYGVKEIAPATGHVSYMFFPPFPDDSNSYLSYFVHPISIEDALRLIKAERKLVESEEILSIRFKLIDLVTRHLLIVGTLEFFP